MALNTEELDAMPAGVRVEGVWIVWSSLTKESINAVFPADAEVNALRMVNRDGFGYAQFLPFGEVTY